MWSLARRFNSSQAQNIASSSHQALVPQFNQSLFHVNISKGAGRLAPSIRSFASARLRIFLCQRRVVYISRCNAGTRFRKNKTESWR